MAQDRFIEHLKTMEEIYRKKNAGYSGQDSSDPWRNFRASELFGISPFDGCMVRISDKFMRISNLMRDISNEQVGESITDTLIDMANYCIIAICLYEEQQKGESKDGDIISRSKKVI